MSFINYSSREINCKLVYYGPGLCGKTTNLQHIYSKTNPELKGKMISLATETERTLFFDFLPLALGPDPRLQDALPPLHGAGPGLLRRQPQADPEGRRRGVSSSPTRQLERMEANLESMDNLKINLREQGYELDKIPFIIQFNKRDLPNAAPLDEMKRQLNPQGVPEFEACATVGKGVFETLKATAKGVLTDLKKLGR